MLALLLAQLLLQRRFQTLSVFQILRVLDIQDSLLILETYLKLVGCVEVKVDADCRRGSARPGLQRDPVIGVADRFELLQHPTHGRLRRARWDLRPRPFAGRHSARSCRAARADGLRLQPPRHPRPSDCDLAMAPREDCRHRYLPQYVGDPHDGTLARPSAPATPTLPTSAGCLPSTFRESRRTGLTSSRGRCPFSINPWYHSMRRFHPSRKP
jgi:hypothetical protein